MSAKETFYLLPGFYSLHFYDMFGDGMGTGSGEANYTLSTMVPGGGNPNIVARSDGNFGYVEITKFEVPGTIP